MPKIDKVRDPNHVCSIITSVWRCSKLLRPVSNPFNEG
jgi:hypothetical protein